MKVWLQNRSLSRFLRLAIGIAVTIQGILVHDALLATLGVLFSLIPLMNAGCGANGACAIRPSIKRPGVNANPKNE
ncbi:hypothetical protein D9M69_710410 [compost metagenome]